MKNFTTPNGFKISQEDADDILANAFEGQANYWIDSNIIVPEFPKGTRWASEVVTRGVTIKIPHGAEDAEDDKSEFAELDLPKLLTGIDMFIKENPQYLDKEKWDLAADADSDSILQYAVFGELVFG